MKKLRPLLPYILGWGLLMSTQSLAEISLINGLSQLILFLFVVCIPAWKTGRMSYVDIGWPWGLVVIGIWTIIFSQGHWLRSSLVGGVYIFMGLRMGMGALQLLKLGYLNTELPRYQYQHRRWERDGHTDTGLVMQVEVLVQGLANAAFLAMPAFVIGTNSSESLSVFEVVGLCVWLGAFIIESVADTQKLAFLKSMSKQGLKNKVCNVGLWRYSRHPNYFAEWMVWNALLIASIPSWIALQPVESVWVWSLMGVGLLCAPYLMYVTLVHYTGAKPAEFYSVQKRPEYKAYQQTTNMFFPGAPKS
jgi:steroid 5-alpha reductase family enzyme